VSTRQTRLFSKASAVPTLADVVVFPTPPFPEVITIASPIALIPLSIDLLETALRPDSFQLTYLIYVHLVVFQVSKLIVRFFNSPFIRRTADYVSDAKLSRFKMSSRNNRCAVAVTPGMCCSFQRTKYVNVAGCNERSTGIDVTDPKHVAFMLHSLSRAND